MHHYAIEDFDLYYRGAYILHPTKGTVVRVESVKSSSSEQFPEGCVVLSDNTKVSLQELDWTHVKTPPLGYRHTLGGKYLFYIQRQAGRRREKGLTPPAISVTVPRQAAAAEAALGIGGGTASSAILRMDLARAIWKPVFKSPKEASKILLGDGLSIGIALSHDWAMVVGLFEDQKLILIFKQATVATSSNGIEWEWSDDVAKLIYDRTFT